MSQVILGRKKELLEIPPDEPEMLYSVLCKLPQRLDLEQLIVDAVALQESHPPESLRSWKNISRYSVLKTARSAAEAASQSSLDAISLFHKQTAQLRFAENRQNAYNVLWTYRRPAATLVLAVLVGLVSWWIRSGALSAANGYGGYFSLPQKCIGYVRKHIFK